MVWGSGVVKGRAFVLRVTKTKKVQFSGTFQVTNAVMPPLSGDANL
jgi:hypothetical protein